MAFLRGKQNPQVQRLRILQQDIEERKNEKVYIESFDFIVKVMDGKSCAVLESVINRAAQNALVAKRKIIEKEDVIEACLNILYSSIEVDHHRPKENIERVAYHEAGHVLVSEILKRDSIVLVSIKNFDSIYGGITSFYLDDSYWASISNRYDRIVSL